MSTDNKMALDEFFQHPQGQTEPSSCTCGDNEVCFKCPEYKRRMTMKKQGMDHNRYVTKAPRQANGLTKREAQHQERVVRSQVERKAGRRLSNAEWSEFKMRLATTVRQGMTGEKA